MPFTKIEVKHIYQNSSHYSGAGVYLPLIWDNRSNLTYTSPSEVYKNLGQTDSIKQLYRRLNECKHMMDNKVVDVEYSFEE